ncbi:MAG: hypothetical protein JNL01_11940 [Bdellovibrionales bacterium]|nr:hypothetical protein [Bdellovibrionales bacterium]
MEQFQSSHQSRSPFPLDQVRVIHDRWNPAYQAHPLLPPVALQALLSGEVQGLFVALFENERPPQGISGWLDQMFDHAVTRAIRSGIVTGKAGEACLIPMTRTLRKDQVYPVVLIGGGVLPIERDPAKRALLKFEFPESGLQAIQKTMTGMAKGGVWKKAAISASDFLMQEPKTLEKKLSTTGGKLWITA